MTKITNYKWAIFIANLNPVKGSEQRGNRPVLVISDEDFNQLMPGRKVYPNEALLSKGVARLPNDSLVLAHQVRTISKARLQKLLGCIKETELMEAINNALRIHFNL